MNLLTDYDGHYAYIDYEISRQFENAGDSLVYNYRGTEVPPECERGLGVDPFKVDVWALAVLILRACKVCVWVGNVAFDDAEALWTVDRVLDS